MMGTSSRLFIDPMQKQGLSRRGKATRNRCLRYGLGCAVTQHAPPVKVWLDNAASTDPVAWWHKVVSALFSAALILCSPWDCTAGDSASSKNMEQRPEDTHDSAEPPAKRERSSPPDTTPYVRPIVPDDLMQSGRPAIGKKLRQQSGPSDKTMNEQLVPSNIQDRKSHVLPAAPDERSQERQPN